MRRSFPSWVARWGAGLALVVSCAPENASHTPSEPDVGVVVVPVRRASMHRWVVGFGTLGSPPAGAEETPGKAALVSPAQGLIEDVLATEGEPVEAGDVLLRFDERSALLRKTQAASALDYAQKYLARQTQLDEIGGTSKQAIELATQSLARARGEFESAEVALSYLRVASPVEGVVSRVLVRPGEFVAANALLIEVLDTHRLVLDLGVPVAEAATVQVGQRVELSDPGGEPVSGQVVFVAPSVAPRTSSVNVRVALTESKGLRSGQFVRCRIETGIHEGSIVVPLAAVYTSHDQLSSVSIVEDGIAHQRPVTLGLREGGLVELLGESIPVGASVVLQGSYGLEDGTRVHELDESMEVGPAQ